MLLQLQAPRACTAMRHAAVRPLPIAATPASPRISLHSGPWRCLVPQTMQQPTRTIQECSRPWRRHAKFLYISSEGVQSAGTHQSQQSKGPWAARGHVSEPTGMAATLDIASTMLLQVPQRQSTFVACTCTHLVRCTSAEKRCCVLLKLLQQCSNVDGSGGASSGSHCSAALMARSRTAKSGHHRPGTDSKDAGGGH